MRFQGKVHREDRFWLAEVPIFEAMTQGRTRKEALEMIGDWFETMVNRPEFSVTVHGGGEGTFEVGSPASLRSGGWTTSPESVDNFVGIRNA